MFYLPFLTALKQESALSAGIRYAPVVLSVFLFGPIWTTGSVLVYLSLKRDGYLSRIWRLVFGLFGFVYLFATQPFLFHHYRVFLAGGQLQALISLALVWGTVLPSVAAGGYAMGFLDKLAKLFEPKTAQEVLDDELRRARRVLKAETTYAIQQAKHTPTGNLLFLGATSYSEPFDPDTGVHNVSGWIGIEEYVLDEHLFIVGGTGAGKTGTIKQLIWEILHKTNRDVFLIDGKGEEKLAQYVRSVAFSKGRGNTPIFRLGAMKHGAEYNGFRGTPNAIWNRLCAMIGIPEAKGDSEYYASINRDILQLVCYAPDGAPKDFRDLRERITLDWLLDTYLLDPQEGALVQSLDKAKVSDLATRFRPLEREFRKVISRDGFALEDVRSFVFSIRTQTALDSGKQFLKFFVDDVRDFVGNRQKRPAVIIIDEFAAFGNENIVNLLSLARSSQLSIVLATQDLSMLGEASLQQQIMANCMTDIVMRTKFPEALSMISGTRKQMEVATQIVEGEPSGVQTIRPQDTFRIPPEEAAKLPNGGAFILRRRTGAKIQVRRVEDKEVPVAPSERFSRVESGGDDIHLAQEL